MDSVTLNSMISFLDRDCAEDYSFAGMKTRDRYVKVLTFLNAHLTFSNLRCKECFAVFCISFCEIVDNDSAFEVEYFYKLQDVYDELNEDYQQCMKTHPNIVKYCTLHYYSFISRMHYLLECEGMLVTRAVSAKLFRMFDKMLTAFNHCTWKNCASVKRKRRNSF